jgi:hypothetical protein
MTLETLQLEKVDSNVDTGGEVTMSVGSLDFSLRSHPSFPGFAAPKPNSPPVSTLTPTRTADFERVRSICKDKPA